MEFEDPGYSDEVLAEFNKICSEIEDEREKLTQLLTLVFGKRWAKYWN